MEYGFAKLRQTEVFRSCDGLSGEQVLVEEYPDCTITHRFGITGVIKKDDNNVWYTIANHNTVVDKTKVLKQQIQEQADALVELAALIDSMEG